jgi:hypothetical protein
MSDRLATTIAHVPVGDRALRPRILFVGDRHLVPPRDGTSTMYCTVLKALASRYSLFAIMFTPPDTDSAAMQAYLSSLCDAHLVIQEKERSRFAKLVRLVGRSFTAGLFAPRFIEEFGRRSIHRRIAAFVREHQINVIVLNKIHTVFRFGYSTLQNHSYLKLIDIRDDFVARETDECRVLQRLRDTYPPFRRLQPYANHAIRCRFRFSTPRAPTRSAAAEPLYPHIGKFGRRIRQVQAYIAGL